MSCFFPQKVFLSVGPDPTTGKRKVLFPNKDSQNRSIPYGYEPIEIRCNKCEGCKMDYAKTWSTRLMHESRLYEKNCVITLTYDEKNLPIDGSLEKQHVSKFMKDLRKKFSYQRYIKFKWLKTKLKVKTMHKEQFIYERRIRFFAAGEYGYSGFRPHYHVCLFNFDFPDKEFIGKTRSGSNEYVSKILNQIWGKGITTIGDFDIKSASYVSRYVIKKQYVDEHYLNYDTGCIRQPEFVLMSRNGGLGLDWFKMWSYDVYPNDRIYLDGHFVKPPRFYDKKLELTNKKVYDEIKELRAKYALKNVANSTKERLATRRFLLQERIKRLKRGIH